jgi:hypothetical protein
MTLSVSRLYSAEWLNDTLTMNWPNQDSILEFSWRDSGKAQKPSVRIAKCSGHDSNLAPSRYKFRVLPLPQTAQWDSSVDTAMGYGLDGTAKEFGFIPGRSNGFFCSLQWPDHL